MDNTRNMSTGPVEVLDPAEAAETFTDADTPYPDESEGLTPGQKVGIGLGATAAVGLAGFGLYKLGQRNGWWSPPSTIIIDDETTPSDGGGSTPKPKPGGSGRAAGKPPNISLDKDGYNTILWPRSGPVRMAMLSQGYKVEVNEEPLSTKDNPNPQVTRFQRDWNAVIRGLDSKKVRLPTEVKKSSLLRHYRGSLQADGIAGKNTLNALEIVLSNYTDNGIRWSTLTEQIR